MPSNLPNSWSAHYAKLAAANNDDDKLPGKYSLVLPLMTAAGTCHINLVLVPNCVTMLISPSGHVYLLHHAHWDKPMPVYTDGSGNIWTLLGMGDCPPVTTFDHRALAESVQAAVPSGKAMCDAPDVAAFKALVADTDASALGLNCNVVVSLSPSLVYHLFSANKDDPFSANDDPAELGTTIVWTMNTVNPPRGVSMKCLAGHCKASDPSQLIFLLFILREWFGPPQIPFLSDLWKCLWHSPPPT
jgi:hypothetical protein